MDNYLFDSNTIALEEFMDYSAMMIAEEGIKEVATKALASIQRMFAKLVIKIEDLVAQSKDSKVKTKLLDLLGRARKGLAKCKSLKKEDPKMINLLEKEANGIKTDLYRAGRHIEEDMAKLAKSAKKVGIDRDSIDSDVDDFLDSF